MDWGLIFIIIVGLWFVANILRAIYTSLYNYFHKPISIREAIEIKNKDDYWYQLKLEAFGKYGRFCSNCGSTVGLHVHHKIPLTEGGSNQVDNLIILCYKCHQKVHGKIISFNNFNNDLYQQTSGFKLPLLSKALEDKIDVNIEYQKSNGEITNRRVTPLSIYKNQNHFYLKTYCHLRKDERTFRVSRIKNIDYEIE